MSDTRKPKRFLVGSSFNDAVELTPQPTTTTVDPGLEASVVKQFSGSVKTVQERPRKVRVSLAERLADLDNPAGLWSRAIDSPSCWAVWKLIAVFGLTPEILAEWSTVDLDETFTIDVPVKNSMPVAKLFHPALLDKHDRTKRVRIGDYTIWAEREFLRSSAIQLKFEVEPLRPLLEEIQKLKWAAAEFEQAFNRAVQCLRMEAEFVLSLKSPSLTESEKTEKRNAQLSILGPEASMWLISAKTLPDALKWMNPLEREVIPKWVDCWWNGAETARRLKMSKSEVSRVVTGFLDRCKDKHRANPSRSTEVWVLRVVDEYDREEPDLEAAFCLAKGGNCAAFDGATIRSNVHRGEFTFERWGKTHWTSGESARDDDGGAIANDGWE
jgi:hypothetical protein